ncbi:class I SAM-dependent methyltransferase [Rhabdothermincola salaria]|uniref:class I SAM-dependent methyltransferase n=1 Tax=Rhabdothermincola salaria TaxID=2903142 RepID=UPI001E374DFA|nr:methyltransferase domain-containing protein [Rhabdothermincola salaria]
MSDHGSRPDDPVHWFESVADHLGEAYLRYSFTKGTENEVAFLVDELGLGPGHRVLDVGCGPGRHAHALGRRGIEVVGVDIARRFVDLARRDAPDGVTFERMDARALSFDGEFDAVISLCQGAFGLSGGGPMAAPLADVSAGRVAGVAPMAGPGARAGDPDAAVLDGMARALKPGGRLAVSAFSAYFQVRFLEHTDRFDAASGVNHEVTSVRSPSGEEVTTDLWTTCFTPRELRLLAVRSGLLVRDLWSVTPGEYARRDPDLDHPEFLMVAIRPSAPTSA